MKTIQEVVKAKQATYKYFTEKEAFEAVKQNGYALAYVKEQTEAICIEAVKQNGDALRYVNESLFIVAPKELTMEELAALLGYEVKIIK